MRTRVDERASVLTELAVVMSTLLLLLAGFFDFTRGFGISQSVSQLSRELANLAFRDCSFLPVVPVGGNESLNGCLQGRINALLVATAQAGGPLATRTQVAVSVYRFEAGAVQLVGSASNGFATRIDAANPRFLRIVETNGVAAVAEVELPITPFFSWLLPAFPEVLYEATIF